MRFVEKCYGLVDKYKNDCLERKNGTLLLKPGEIPRARHYMYKPLNREYMKEYLIDAYKNKMPEEYLELLSSFNGASLFVIKYIVNENLAFAYCRFSIYGLPIVPTSLRAEYGEEPIDIRTMDIERHDGISAKWLKIGEYVKSLESEVFHDIFVDTESGNTYTCQRRTLNIDAKWESLDSCLCDIFDYLSNTTWEYTEK